MFCASDIGWVVGHCYILYGPLLAGATTVLYEGKPVGTPDSGAFWRVIEEHKANSLFTAPTALRAIRKDDPEGKKFEEVGRRGGLKQLRALFLAGERSEPSIVQVYQELLSKHAAPGAVVIDNWWSSESGSPITALALRSGVGFDQESKEQITPPAIRPGSAGKPMPGYDVRIVDDEGNEVENGKMGNIVMGMPMSPTSFTTLFNDEERYYKGYLKRFNGKWVDTGDAGMIDQDGYVHIMSRSDDIINVAAHRFSTGTSHPNQPFLPSDTNLTNHRLNRTSPPNPPLRLRSLRNRPPRPPKRPRPLRLHPPNPFPPRHLSSNPTPHPPALPKRPNPHPNRGHRVTRRRDTGSGHDPEDEEREDAAEGSEGACGECG